MVPKTLLSLIENSEYLKTVSDLYSSNGYEFYLVGGAVRDGILDIETTDFDFTTNASPEDSIDLLINNGYKTTEIGSPSIDGATVEAKLLDNVKDRTVLIFHKRRRKHSRKKNGHRQRHSKIQITKIMSKDGKVIDEAKIDVTKKTVKKETVEKKKVTKK